VSHCIRLYRDFFADFDEPKVHDLLSFFGLDENMRLKAMSKGMREKVQVALTMSRRAKLFLLDEPISGVDPAAREVILNGILRNLEEDSMLLIATHLVHDLEPILDSVVMMRHGNVVLQGDADDLRETHSMSLDALFRETYR
jgi:ABC-2 type transport system ATP-binding protein